MREFAILTRSAKGLRDKNMITSLKIHELNTVLNYERSSYNITIQCKTGRSVDHGSIRIWHWMFRWQSIVSQVSLMRTSRILNWRHYIRKTSINWWVFRWNCKSRLRSRLRCVFKCRIVGRTKHRRIGVYIVSKEPSIELRNYIICIISRIVLMVTLQCHVSEFITNLTNDFASCWTRSELIWRTDYWAMITITSYNEFYRRKYRSPLY